MDCSPAESGGDVPSSSRKRKRSGGSVGGTLDAYEPQVGIIYSEKLFETSSKLPKVENRADVVHGLIGAYDLFRNMKVYSSVPAGDNELLMVHSSGFIEYIKEINTKYTAYDEVDLDYSLGYDCPPLDGIYDYVREIAGSSLTAAKLLNSGTVDIMINWCGGWHHAQRDEIGGLCYVNDIVLAIYELRKRFENILYVDLDIHHGNGVENSFYTTAKVMTVSFHKFEPGYYPGSGSVSDVGRGPGRFYSVNVPLKSGIKDDSYCSVFDRVMSEVLRVYDPDAFVIQCGADGVAGDPLGGFNLTAKSYCHCVKFIADLRKPTLILGGGGYNIPNTSRCWTSVTASVLGIELKEEIPDFENFMMFGPGYELTIEPTLRKDENKKEDIEMVISTITSNMKRIEYSDYVDV